MTLPFSSFIFLELFAESVLIFGAGGALVLLAWLECDDDDAPDCASFGGKLQLALTSVRISSDSIFGWKEREPSSGWEVFFF